MRTKSIKAAYYKVKIIKIAKNVIKSVKFVMSMCLLIGGYYHVVALYFMIMVISFFKLLCLSLTVISGSYQRLQQDLDRNNRNFKEEGFRPKRFNWSYNSIINHIAAFISPLILLRGRPIDIV